MMDWKSPKRLFSLALLAALPLALGACDDDVTGPLEGRTEVLLSRAGTTTASASLSRAVLASSFAAPVELDQVASIDVRITGVQVLRAEDVEDETEDDAEDGWIALELADEAGFVDIDLLELPTTAGILLAAAELEAGLYENMRLFFSDATITFNTPIRVGQQSYPANEPIDLFIPSGLQTGIKLPQASFTVPAAGGEQITVEFDASASVRGIHATGANRIIMTPVLGVEED